MEYSNSATMVPERSKANFLPLWNADLALSQTVANANESTQMIDLPMAVVYPATHISSSHIGKKQQSFSISQHQRIKTRKDA